MNTSTVNTFRRYKYIWHFLNIATFNNEIFVEQSTFSDELFVGNEFGTPIATKPSSVMYALPRATICLSSTN